MISVGILAGQVPAAAVAEPTFRAWGTAAPSDFTATAPPPAGAVSTDCLIAMMMLKGVNADATCTGYTRIGFIASGTVTSAPSQGSVKTAAFYKTGATPGNAVGPGLIWQTMKIVRQAAVYSNNAVALAVPVAYMLADTDPSGTSVSATNTGTTPDIAAGDLLLLAVATTNDGTYHTSPSLTIPGCTLSAITWEAVTPTSQGDDGCLYVGRCTVSSGSATGWPTYTATATESSKSDTAVAVVRIR